MAMERHCLTIQKQTNIISIKQSNNSLSAVAAMLAHLAAVALDALDPINNY
jgi:hypothetical protein